VFSECGFKKIVSKITKVFRSLRSLHDQINTFTHRHTGTRTLSLRQPCTTRTVAHRLLSWVPWTDHCTECITGEFEFRSFLTVVELTSVTHKCRTFELNFYRRSESEKTNIFVWSFPKTLRWESRHHRCRRTKILYIWNQHSETAKELWIWTKTLVTVREREMRSNEWKFLRLGEEML
jgi:hypothetical protein